MAVGVDVLKISMRLVAAMTLVLTGCNTFIFTESMHTGPPPAYHSSKDEPEAPSIEARNSRDEAIKRKSEPGFYVVRPLDCVDDPNSKSSSCEGFIFTFKLLCPGGLHGSTEPLADATVIGELQTGARSNGRSDRSGLTQLSFHRVPRVVGQDLKLTVNGGYVTNVDPTTSTEIRVPMMNCLKRDE